MDSSNYHVIGEDNKPLTEQTKQTSKTDLTDQTSQTDETSKTSQTDQTSQTDVTDQKCEALKSTLKSTDDECIVRGPIGSFKFSTNQNNINAKGLYDNLLHIKKKKV